VLREADNIEQSEEYDVEEVMSSVERGRGNNKRILYLVKWLDYPERKDWTEEQFDNCSVGGQRNSRSFINEIQTYRGTTSSPRARPVPPRTWR